jgi:hypothetical protein
MRCLEMKADKKGGGEMKGSWGWCLQVGCAFSILFFYDLTAAAAAVRQSQAPVHPDDPSLRVRKAADQQVSVISNQPSSVSGPHPSPRPSSRTQVSTRSSPIPSPSLTAPLRASVKLPSKKNFEVDRQECEQKMKAFLEAEVALPTQKQSSEAKRMIVKNLLKENVKGYEFLKSQNKAQGASSYLCQDGVPLKDLIFLRSAVAVRELSSDQGWLGSFYQKQIQLLREARACALRVLEHRPRIQDQRVAEESYLRIQAEVMRRLKAEGFNSENLDPSDSLGERLQALGSVTDLNDDSGEGRGEDVVLSSRAAPAGLINESRVDVSPYFSQDGCTSRELMSEVDAVEVINELLSGVGSIQSQRRSVNNRKEAFRQPEPIQRARGASRHREVFESEGETAR